MKCQYCGQPITDKCPGQRLPSGDAVHDGCALAFVQDATAIKEEPKDTLCPRCGRIVSDDHTIIDREGYRWHLWCGEDRTPICRHNIDLSSSRCFKCDKNQPVGKTMDRPKPKPLPASIAGTTKPEDDPRHKSHGTFENRSRIAQRIKDMMAHASIVGNDPVIAKTNWKSLRTDQRQALEEIAGKISRILCGDPDDPEHWDDIAGYSKLVSDRLKGVVR